MVRWRDEKLSRRAFMKRASLFLVDKIGDPKRISKQYEKSSCEAKQEPQSFRK